jgi:hypothetical protein
MIRASRQHLKNVEQGYWSHALFAWKWGLYLIGTGLISLVHGLVPAWLPFQAPRNVMKVACMIEANGNPDEMGDQ